jgi:tRNA 2-thiouridine synthesizing protein A
MTMVIEADVRLDCFGLLCPMPIIQTARKMKEMVVGQVLEVVSTDAGIKGDMPSWCKMTGQEFLGFEESGDIIRVYVRKLRD